MAELNPIKRKTLYKQIADELKGYIIENNLKTGDRLPTENELARMLGVSRPSVREGIRYLETLGFIETGKQTGITVKKGNLQPITDYLIFNLKRLKVSWRELLEAREMLETDAIELAINNINEDQLGLLEKNIQEFEKKVRSFENADEEDFMFHYLIFKATRNKVMEQLSVIIKEFFYNEDLVEQLVKNNNISDQNTLDAHIRIFKAIKKKDTGKAREEMLKHLSEYEKLDLK